MTPEDEQAILQARADLGNVRMASLPLSGAVVPTYMKTLAKKSLHDLDENVAAWHAIVPEEDLDLVIRPDGIGAGDSHRYGKNYRPDSLRQCNYCHKPGHVVSQCPVFPRITSTKTHMTGSSRLSVPPDYGRHGKRKKRSPIPVVSMTKTGELRADASRMYDKSMDAACPDIAASKPYQCKDFPKSSPASPLTPPTQEGSSKRPDTAVKQDGQATTSNKTIRAQRPRRAPMQLTDLPFWQSAAPIVEKSQNTKTSDPGKLDSTETWRESVAVETIKQSSKGYLQERSTHVPKHYNQIIFPPEIPKTEGVPEKNKPGQEKGEDNDDEEYDDDDDDCVSVYTDPTLNSGTTHKCPAVQCDMQSSKEPRQLHKKGPSEKFSNQHGKPKPVLPAVRTAIEALSSGHREPLSQSSPRSTYDCAEFSEVIEESGLFDDVFELLAQKDSIGTPGISNPEPVKPGFLFRIILDENCSIEMYDNDTPEQMCARICRARCIEDEQIKADFLRKIDMKFKKALRARVNHREA